MDRHKFDYIIPSFGIHPWEADRFSDDLSKIDQYIEESPMIGEVGLDYHFVEVLNPVDQISEGLPTP